jgi:hypothetical protein
MSESQTIYGMDFSGAKEAGNKIWVAKGVPDGKALVIEACLKASELPNSGEDINVCLAALLNLVKSNPKAVYGFDFPFGLPHGLITEKTWEEWVLAFPKKYENPEAFRRSCRQACKGKELKRQTDKESRTPFSSYNLRLYRQTYFGICSVLRPLVLGDYARTLPMQKHAAGKPVVVEICPASTLKAAGLYGPYKRKSEVHRAARQSILDRLLCSSPFRIGNQHVRVKAIEDTGGDALDSIIAATAAFHAMKCDFIPRKGNRDLYAIEGYVFA